MPACRGDLGMRIAISAGIFPPDIGGPANFVPRIARWLAGRGHTISVVCWSDAVEHDDSTYPFPVRRIARGRSRVGRSLATIAALRENAAAADLVFANTLDAEAHAAARLAGKPIVHKVVGDRAWEIARTRGWFDGTIDAYQTQRKSGPLRLLDAMRSYPLRRARRIFVPSAYLARLVARWGVVPGRIEVIPNATPIDAENGTLRLPQFSGRTVATVCRLVPWKGVDRLIGVVAGMPDTRLVIAGDGPERAMLESIAARTGAGDRVLFLGNIDPADVRAVLAVSDAFVLNSSYEGMPHVVLEAMAARVPVVATDVGGTAELVRNGETGLLIPAGDDTALEAALANVFCGRGVPLAKAARLRVEREFGEEACFRRYEAGLLEAGAPGSRARQMQ